MRNLIPFLGAILIYSNSFGQTIESIDTLRFAPDTSYSRIVVRYSKDELVFGTSKSGVILFNEKKKQISVLVPPVSCGEFRDLTIQNGNIYSIVSGDSGIVYEINIVSQTVKTLFKEKGVFLDDIVSNKNLLIILGDPTVNGGAFFIHKFDPETNTFVPFTRTVFSKENEGCFAASGTCAQFPSPRGYSFVSGGPNSARYHIIDLRNPDYHASTGFVNKLEQGTGPYSLFYITEKKAVVVGGDYKQPDKNTQNSWFSSNGGITWESSIKPANGYRSCVTGNKKILFACGTNGIDYSSDDGKTWNFLMKGNFCALLLDGKTLYATTNKGYCLKLKLKFN